MKLLRWLEIRKLSENSRRKRFQPRPHSLLSGKREDPEDQGVILVPDLMLTASFKMAAKENT